MEEGAKIGLNRRFLEIKEVQKQSHPTTKLLQKRAFANKTFNPFSQKTGNPPKT